MRKPVETTLTFGHNPSLTYENDAGRINLEAIDNTIDELFAHADELHRGLLPEEASFANHNLKGVPRQKMFALERFFKAYERYQIKEVKAVRLRLNDYVEQLGLGIVSVSVEPLNVIDEDAGIENLVLPDDDFKAPSLGNVLPPAQLRQQILALFRVDFGNAEQVNGDGEIHARTYSHNEKTTPSAIQEPGILGSRRNAIIVPAGSSIGVSMPVLDPAKFEGAGIRHQQVLTDRMGGSSQLYTCRNLKPDAAARMMFLGC